MDYKLTFFQQGDDCPIDWARDSGTLRAIRIFNSVRIISTGAAERNLEVPIQEGTRSARNREVV